MKPWHPFWVDKVPYVLASVELPEQPDLKMLTNIVECEHDALEIGMPVEVTFREVAAELTLPFFKPVGS